MNSQLYSIHSGSAMEAPFLLVFPTLCLALRMQVSCCFHQGAGSVLRDSDSLPHSREGRCACSHRPFPAPSVLHFISLLRVASGNCLFLNITFIKKILIEAKLCQESIETWRYISNVQH